MFVIWLFVLNVPGKLDYDDGLGTTYTTTQKTKGQQRQEHEEI